MIYSVNTKMWTELAQTTRFGADLRPSLQEGRANNKAGNRNLPVSKDKLRNTSLHPQHNIDLSFLQFFSRTQPTINLPCISPQSSVTCNGEYRRPVIKAQPSFDDVDTENGERKRYVEYVNKWCHVFYVQAYRLAHRSR